MEGSIARSEGGFVARGFEALERTNYHLAETSSEKEEIYRLRYRAYSNEGWIEPNDTGRLTDAYDDQPNSFTFGLKHDGLLVGSLRVQLACPPHRLTSSTATFPD